MNDTLTVFPTHTAFDDCNENLINIMKHERDGRYKVGAGEILIVHGIVAPYGYDMANAWLERDGKSVVFSGIVQGQKAMLTAELKSWYADVKVKESKKYTIFQARDEEIRTGHYGPWVENIRALCPDLKEEFNK